MLVAEELECDWAKIKGEFASPNRNVREKQCLQGSETRVGFARRLPPPGNICSRPAPARACAPRSGRGPTVGTSPHPNAWPKNGAVLHKASNRRFTYGQIAADASKIKLDKEPEIKSPDQFKADRQAAAAPRYAGEGEWRGEVRHRYQKCPTWSMPPSCPAPSWGGDIGIGR